MNRTTRAKSSGDARQANATNSPINFDNLQVIRNTNITQCQIFANSFKRILPLCKSWPAKADFDCAISRYKQKTRLNVSKKKHLVTEMNKFWECFGGLHSECSIVPVVINGIKQLEVIATKNLPSGHIVQGLFGFIHVGSAPDTLVSNKWLPADLNLAVFQKDDLVLDGPLYFLNSSNKPNITCDFHVKGRVQALTRCFIPSGTPLTINYGFSLK